MLGPLLQTIEARLKVVYNRTQVLAILDIKEINIGIQWAKYAFEVAKYAFEVATLHSVPTDLDQQIQVLNVSI